MKLEIGKTYRSRDGKEIVHIIKTDDDIKSEYDYIGDNDCHYTYDGFFFATGQSGKFSGDLTEENDKHIGSRHHIDEEMGGAHNENHMQPGDTHRSTPAYGTSPAASCLEDIHTLAAMSPEERVAAIVNHVDAFLYDVKDIVRLRDYTSEERKGIPIHTGVMLYFPDALAAIARVSKAGNDKHNPGEPLHWSREKSSDHSDCAGRHMLTPDRFDPDTGQTERAQIAWRTLADLQIAEERRLIAAGIKPLSGVIT